LRRWRDSDPNANSNGDGYSYCDSHRHRHSYCHWKSNGHADGNTIGTSAYANAARSPDASSSPVGRVAASLGEAQA
jgi:hypothetical protein